MFSVAVQKKRLPLPGNYGNSVYGYVSDIRHLLLSFEGSGASESVRSLFIPRTVFF